MERHWEVEKQTKHRSMVQSITWSNWSMPKIEAGYILMGLVRAILKEPKHKVKVH